MRKNSIAIYIFLSLIGFLVQSCFVAKKYERPTIEYLDSLYRTDALTQDSVSMASIPWQTLFTDSLLVGYIREGLENNMDIRIALQQIVAAEAYMKQGRAAYMPSLNGKATFTHQELAKNSQFGSIFDGSLEQFELSGILSWEVDVWGKIRSGSRAVQAIYLQSIAGHKAVKTTLISAIVSNYYQLLALDEQYRITQETIENRKRSLTTIEALKNAGNVTQVAVDQTAAQLYNAQALLIDLEIDTFRTENAMNILLGKPSQTLKRDVLENQTIHNDLALGVPALLLRNRPDVMAAEFNLVNAFELTNVSKSNFYPALTLSGTMGFQSLTLNTWFDAGSVFATLVGGLAQPIFNKRQIRTQYEVSLAQQQESLLNFKKTLLIAGLEVSNALYEYKAETRKYDFRQKEVVALRQAESNSELLLNNGFGTYLDLLTARQNALNAELNVIDSKLRQLQGIVILYRALGGGW